MISDIPENATGTTQLVVVPKKSNQNLTKTLSIILIIVAISLILVFMIFAMFALFSDCKKQPKG